ncbi:hypothetical protein M5K25_019463 [Dendrobium thyrsiflorum]|uniref:Uncharacterized protein n=1 Tax=Dendrobium thyrsiflorum TaxID=117978 RepID=A0ABD0UFN8_DENTH
MTMKEKRPRKSSNRITQQPTSRELLILIFPNSLLPYFLSRRPILPFPPRRQHPHPPPPLFPKTASLPSSKSHPAPPSHSSPSSSCTRPYPSPTQPLFFSSHIPPPLPCPPHLIRRPSQAKPPPLPPDPLSPFGIPCMGDPEVDSGFVFDEEGRTDILGSLFFDVFFGADETVDDYLDRILYQLSLSLEEHIRPGRWIIIGHRPPPPTPTTFPSSRILSASFLIIISLIVWCFTFH